jgi:hypothetical protein
MSPNAEIALHVVLSTHTVKAESPNLGLPPILDAVHSEPCEGAEATSGNFCHGQRANVAVQLFGKGTTMELSVALTPTAPASRSRGYVLLGAAASRGRG